MHFITNAYAATAPTVGQGAPSQGGLITFLPIILIVVVFYFLLIRPQSKMRREQKAMIAALTVGDEVVTASGLLVRVVELGPLYTTVEIASGVRAKIQTATIQQVLPKGTIDKAQ
ncbi:MAG: preprotein translocase subunit YajC [Gammaproteobacteria bacterium]|nr:preprotein translocase subunit YajC [Gammaproteobacteria bacterium]